MGGGLVACASSVKAKPNVADARQAVGRGAFLLDVRTPEEFAAGHVPGAINIPVDQLEQRLGELGPTDAPIVVYCHSGRRSARAARLLDKQGYRDVLDVGPKPDW